MDYRKVTAIIRLDRADQVGKALKVIGVPGVSCTHVKGYGEYADFYSDDWQVSHARFEVFIEKGRVQEVVDAIMEHGRTGVSGDGIVAVLPVEHLYRIRTGRDATSDDP